MPEEQEIMKTARQLEEIDKRIKENTNQIEVLKNSILNDKDTAHKLSLKMTSLVSPFNYGLTKPKPEHNPSEPRHLVSRAKLTEILGPLIYTGQGGGVRQKTYEYLVTLPFV